jgi:small-conductance mechanosensitive channel
VSRLRTALVFAVLAGTVWLLALLPASVAPNANIVRAIASALAELAAAQLAVILLFDLLLRKVRIPKVITEILIAASYVAVIFHLLYRLGVNVTGIFATSAVAAAVVGLALQDMLSNLASGISLEIEGGIEVGDFIRVGDATGWVEHVRLRHTALTTPDGDTVIVPNSQITRAVVSIVAKKHRHFVPFTMSYDVNPQAVIDAVQFALRASPLPAIATDPPPLCVVRELLPGHIVYAAVVWHTRPGHFTTEHSAVLTRISFALRRAGIPATGISQVVDLKTPAEAEARTLGPVDVLRRTPILRLLSEPDIQEVGSHLKHLSFAPGEHIITQGEEGSSMFFIVSGSVSISFRGTDRVESRISLMEAGDFFGEASLLTGERRSANAIAVTAVDCYRLDKSGLETSCSACRTSLKICL